MPEAILILPAHVVGPRFRGTKMTKGIPSLCVYLVMDIGG